MRVLADYLLVLLFIPSMKISVSLPDELVKAIDAERRDVPRSRFIRRALEARMGAPETIEESPPSQSKRSPTSRSEAFARATQR